MPILGSFLKFTQFWLKSSAQNEKLSILWKNSLLLIPRLTPNSQDQWRYIQFYTLFWNLATAAPPIIFSETSKVTSNISIYDLMTICRVLLLIIGQNHINPKLLQPIVASICKVMTVKKPCVRLMIRLALIF